MRIHDIVGVKPLQLFTFTLNGKSYAFALSGTFWERVGETWLPGSSLDLVNIINNPDMIVK